MSESSHRQEFGPGEQHPAMMRIDQHRRLVSDEIKEQFEITEYSELLSHHRIMAIPKSSEQAALHQSLMHKNVPVFHITGVDEQSILLDIPADARTIKQSLRFIARDIAHYGEIFRQIGEVIGRCQVAGVGLPEKLDGRSILSSMAFSLDSTDTFGGGVHLLPPYQFNTDISKTDEFQLMRGELLDSPYLNEPMVDELLRVANEGWNHVRS